MKVHPVAQMFPMLSDQDLQRLADSIKRDGLLHPCVRQGDLLLDGRNRYAACAKAGVEVRWEEYDGDSPVGYIIASNLHRRHLERGQQIDMAVKLLPHYEEEARRRRAHGTTAPGRTLGGDHPQAMDRAPRARDLAAEAVGLKDGKVVSDAARIRDERPDLYEQVVADELTVNAAKDFIAGKRPHVANNTGQFEWYTPAEFVDAARRVMGTIDLDPASCELANRVVQAKRIYTKEDDGLAQTWRGRVWLNPPYAKGLIDAFADKVASERPNYKELIAIVNNGTETKWFATLVSVASALCLPRGRVKFYPGDGCERESGPLQGQAILYVGDDQNAFVCEFASMGTCWTRV